MQKAYAADPPVARSPLSVTTSGYGVEIGTDGELGFAMRIDYRAGIEWPHAILKPRDGTWDAGAASAMLLPVANVDDHPIELNLRIGDDAAATWPAHALAAKVTLPPRSRRTVALLLSAQDPRQMGMRAGPPRGGNAALAEVARRRNAPLAVVEGAGTLNRAAIASVYLIVWSQQAGHRLLVGEPTFALLESAADAYRGLIDTFGQSTRGQSPERVRDEADLKARAAREGQALRAAAEPPAPPKPTKPPPFNATGFYRTQRGPDGRWSLVTPDGQRFFSLGVDTVAQHDGATYIEGREAMFIDPPARDGPLAGHYGRSDLRNGSGSQSGRRFDHGLTFNFYTANLQRKFGSDYQARWRSQTLQRLRAWNFNTLGNWADPSLLRREQPDRLPYTFAISIDGEFGRLSDGVDYWGLLPDPYDPRFAAVVDTRLREATAALRDDPLLVGYFIDNELSWGNGRSPDPRVRYALASNVLARAEATPARRALFALLRERYATPQAWRDAWHLTGSQPASNAIDVALSGREPDAAWEALLIAPIPLSENLPSAAQSDLATFSRQVADAYYRTIAQALKRHDPNHLYLGSRFAAQTDEAVGACDRYCDVVSFNIYARDFEPARRDRFGELTKPVLIGEFNFSSTDRGPFWGGLVEVADEGQRAVAYARYVSAAAADPQVVGIHWFQFLDEPASGRLLDGENAHFGLVSIADVPYEDFVAGVSQANRRALDARVNPGGK